MIAVGDEIAVLDEAISGIVIAVNGDEISIEDEDGFVLTFSKSEVIKVTNATQTMTTGLEEMQQIIKEKEPPKKTKPIRSKSKKGEQPPMEVDLHIHKLVASTKGMTNFDMLNIQVATAKRQLDFAIHKRIPRVVFIHGVGEGVLKAELEYVFRSYDNIKVTEADYKKYGWGAMEIYILQNPRSFK